MWIIPLAIGLGLVGWQVGKNSKKGKKGGGLIQTGATKAQAAQQGRAPLYGPAQPADDSVETSAAYIKMVQEELASPEGASPEEIKTAIALAKKLGANDTAAALQAKYDALLPMAGKL